MNLNEQPPLVSSFHRVREGKLLAGVCTGLARYLNVDVTFVRVVFAVAAVFSFGLAFWAYVFLWFVAPPAPGMDTPLSTLHAKVKAFITPTPQGQPRPDQQS